MSKAVPEPVTKLTQAFSRLPGIGPKTAARLVYFLLRAPDDLTTNLAEALRALKEDTQFCSTCGNITVDDPCPICSDSHRDPSLIMVVEEPLDVLAMERTGAFHGVYHVLHGVLSPVNGVSASDIRIGELITRVSDSDVLEIIIATNPGMVWDKL
jgi:recombination protein RecR